MFVVVVGGGGLLLATALWNHLYYLQCAFQAPLIIMNQILKSFCASEKVLVHYFTSKKMDFTLSFPYLNKKN